MYKEEKCHIPTEKTSLVTQCRRATTEIRRPVPVGIMRSVYQENRESSFTSTPARKTTFAVLQIRTVILVGYIRTVHGRKETDDSSTSVIWRCRPAQYSVNPARAGMVTSLLVTISGGKNEISANCQVNGTP